MKQAEEISQTNQVGTVTGKKARYYEQDIAKGLAMIIVMYGHCMAQTQAADHIIRAVFGYVMTFFFFISGYYYRPGNKLSYGEKIKKRAKQILIPLLVYSLGVLIVVGAIGLFSTGVTGLIDIIKAYIGMWVTDPIASLIKLPTIGTFVGNQRAFEPYWFLLHMFSAYVVYYAVVEYAFKNAKNFISANVLLVTITTILYQFNIVLPWGFHNAFAIASIMMLGTLFGKHKMLSPSPENGNKWYVINVVVSFLFVFILGLLFPRAGHISGSGQMAKVLGPIEVPYTVLFSMVCTFFLIGLSRLLLKIPCINKFLIWFGENSLTVLLTHLIFIFASKMIVGADMNTTLGFVDYFDWKNFFAFLLSIVLMSAFLLIQVFIKKNHKKQIEG